MPEPVDLEAVESALAHLAFTRERVERSAELGRPQVERTVTMTFHWAAVEEPVMGVLRPETVRALADEVRALRARRDAVLALHIRQETRNGPVCQECLEPETDEGCVSVEWPCLTVQALEGEELADEMSVRRRAVVKRIVSRLDDLGVAMDAERRSWLIKQLVEDEDGAGQ